MPERRLPMRHVREVLRLHFEAKLNERQIAKICSVGKGTVRRYLKRIAAVGLVWPLPADLDDATLEQRIFPPPPPGTPGSRPLPDFPVIHKELKSRQNVTLQLLWEEHHQDHPEGCNYSWFCELYRNWSRNLDIVLRQEHRAGERTFVDRAVQTVPATDPRTGEVREAYVFVAVLGASSYTYAEATWTRNLWDWCGSHVRAFEFFQGTSKARIDELLEEALVDANGESEQATGFYTVLENDLRLPFETQILGVTATVESIDITEDDQLVAVCRAGKTRQRISLSELPLPSPPPAGAEWIAAYRYWKTGAMR